MSVLVTHRRERQRKLDAWATARDTIGNALDGFVDVAGNGRSIASGARAGRPACLRCAGQTGGRLEA
jgi:hypothetical protein